jgi:predicted lysophospholipase L1 biosynthesis ABC-type transport system permease subunit
MLVSGIMLSAVPWPLASLNGANRVIGLVLAGAFVLAALFFLWMGIGMFKVNSRELKNAQKAERTGETPGKDSTA